MLFLGGILFLVYFVVFWEQSEIRLILLLPAPQSGSLPLEFDGWRSNVKQKPQPSLTLKRELLILFRKENHNPFLSEMKVFNANRGSGSGIS